MAKLRSELFGLGPATHQGARHARLFHVGLIAMAISIGLLFRYCWAGLASSKSQFARRLADDAQGLFRDCNSAECFGEQAAGRTTLATFAYLVLMAATTTAQPLLHFGYLLQKLFLWLVVLVVMFLVPNRFSTYLLSWDGIVIAVLDLLAALELISFAYNIMAERRSSKIGDAVGVLLWLLTLAGVVTVFVQLMAAQSCSVLYPIMMVVQIAIVIGALVLTRFVASHSLLVTTAIVIAYSSLALYRAIAYRSRRCNAPTLSVEVIDAIGVGINVVVILYRSMSLRPVSIFGVTRRRDPQDDVDLTLPTAIGTNAKPLAAPVRVPARWSSSIFYLILGLMTLYVAVATGPERDLKPSTASFAFAVATSALTSTLFLWTLIAPWLLPHRDFGIRPE